jgi:ubiquinone/menaquinone biosynthesis C-methylase UbiE
LAATPGWQLVAVDQAGETLKVASHAKSERGQTLQDMNVQFIHANITRLPLEEGSVDAVLLFNVLEEMPSLRAVFREVRLCNADSPELVRDTAEWLPELSAHVR